MSKTIEEAAKQAIIDNNYFMADPNHPDFVDRGLEQMRACKWVIGHIFSLPLASRLNAEEKERVKVIYNEELGMAQHFHAKAKASNDISCRQHYYGLREPYISRMKLLERIFGADFFKEGE